MNTTEKKGCPSKVSSTYTETEKGSDCTTTEKKVSSTSDCTTTEKKGCCSSKVSSTSDCTTTEKKGCCSSKVSSTSDCTTTEKKGCCSSKVSSTSDCTTTEKKGCCSSKVSSTSDCTTTEKKGCCPSKVSSKKGCSPSKVSSTFTETKKGSKCTTTEEKGCCPSKVTSTYIETKQGSDGCNNKSKVINKPFSCSSRAKSKKSECCLILSNENSNNTIKPTSTDQAAVSTNIAGMTCAGCSTRIENFLLETNGIVSVSISLLTHHADIFFDPQVISSSDILSMIDGLGFKTSERIQMDSESTGLYVEVRVGIDDKKLESIENGLSKME
eukprot:Pgem_evm1s18941